MSTTLTINERKNNPQLGGLHLTCDAHFWTRLTYSSQKSCVKRSTQTKQRLADKIRGIMKDNWVSVIEREEIERQLAPNEMRKDQNEQLIHVDPALIGYLDVRQLVSRILGTWRRCGVVEKVSYIQGPAQPLVTIHHPHVSTASSSKGWGCLEGCIGLPALQPVPCLSGS